MIKLIKYEIKCLLKMLKPIYLSFFALSIIAGLTLFLISGSGKESFGFLSAFISLTMYILIVGFLTSTVFLPIMHFFKSMVKNEAYQTFSLPMDVKVILFAKLLSIVASNILGSLAAFFSMLCLNQNGDVIITIVDHKVALWGEIIECNIIVLLLLILLLLASSYSMYNLLVFAAIAIGQTISRNVVSGSFLAGIALYMLMTVFFLPIVLLMTIMAEGTMNIVLFCVSCIAVMWLINILFFWISKKLFEERLNLI